uniref:glutathione transferase n=1 Tax=Panagrolaimus davidi TaxID=227884 RepID=A0A914Q0H9_9BILA
MPIKLQYLGIRYLAEPARLILNYANEPFEDCRYNQENWEPIKASSPYNTVPILTVDGEQIAQSMAIYHYLARRFGLAGKGEIEIAKVEAIGEYFREMMNKILPYLLFLIGKNPGGTKVVLVKTVKLLLKKIRSHIKHYVTKLKKFIQI